MPSYIKNCPQSVEEDSFKEQQNEKEVSVLLINHGYGSFHCRVDAAEVIEALFRSRFPRFPHVNVS